jgi:MFS transporter, putative metabolite:H+ symporter
LRVTQQDSLAGQPGGAAEGAHDVPARLDRLPVTRLHFLVIIACTIGFGFDLLEVALGSALSAVFSAPPYSVPRDHLSVLLSAVYLGAIAGAPAMGWLADKVGRRNVLTGGLLWLALTSLAMTTTDRIEFLVIFRLLAGIALGAYPPLMLAYLADILPAARRGPLTMMAIAFAALGQPLGLFLIRWLTPIHPFGLEGWKCVFIVGSVGAVAAAVLFRFIPESPRWLAATGRVAEAEAGYRAFAASPAILSAKEPPPVPVAADPLTSPWFRRYRRGLAVMGGLYFLGPWALVGFPLTTGAVLIAKGFKLTDTLLFIAVASFGPFFGTFLAAFGADRLARRTAIALGSTAMALAVGVFALSTSPAGLIAGALGFQLISNIYLAVLAIYAAELFPTRFRSSASAATWAVNRVASAAAPLVLFRVLQAQGVGTMFAVIASALVASALLVLAFGPKGRAGRPVD